MEDLMKQMRGLSAWEESYAILYARCAHCFPNVARELPKPVFIQHTPNNSFFQAPAPAPMQVVPPLSNNRQWAQPAEAIHMPQHPSDPAAFFRPSTRFNRCAFCMHLSHCVRECQSAQDYVRVGHAVVIDN